MNDLSIESLVCGYGNNVVTEAFSRQCSETRLIAVTGENGTGKSTLMRTLCGFQKPIRGRVLIDGHEVHHLGDRDRARRISLVSTGRESGAGLEVVSAIALGRYAHRTGMGFSTQDEMDVALAHLREWNLTHLAGKRLFELSDGEYQRVMILRGLAQEAAVLVLDEPTAFLDYKARVTLMEWLSSLVSEKGTTVIFSTHDLNLVREFAKEVWHIENKRINALAGDISAFYPERQITNGNA